jgi:hypothetical protein
LLRHAARSTFRSVAAIRLKALGTSAIASSLLISLEAPETKSQASGDSSSPLASLTMAEASR